MLYAQPGFKRMTASSIFSKTDYGVVLSQVGIAPEEVFEVALRRALYDVPQVLVREDRLRLSQRSLVGKHDGLPLRL